MVKKPEKIEVTTPDKAYLGDISEIGKLTQSRMALS